MTNTSSAFTENIVLGSDYDRANGNTNTKLYSIETTNVSKAFDCSNESTKLNMHILSGTFGTNDMPYMKLRVVLMQTKKFMLVLRITIVITAWLPDYWKCLVVIC